MRRLRVITKRHPYTYVTVRSWNEKEMHDSRLLTQARKGEPHYSAPRRQFLITGTFMERRIRAGERKQTHTQHTKTQVKGRRDGGEKGKDGETTTTGGGEVTAGMPLRYKLYLPSLTQLLLFFRQPYAVLPAPVSPFAFALLLGAGVASE